MLTGETFITTPAVNAIRDALRDRLPVVILSGPEDSGKSTAAAWAVWRMCEDASKHQRGGMAAFWTGAYELSTMPFWGDEATKIRKALLGARLLIVEDLGKEAPTKNWQGELRRILESRINSKRPTVFTTRKPLHALEGAYSEGVGWKRFDKGNGFRAVQVVA